MVSIRHLLTASSHPHPPPSPFFFQSQYKEHQAPGARITNFSFKLNLFQYLSTLLKSVQCNVRSQILDPRCFFLIWCEQPVSNWDICNPPSPPSRRSLLHLYMVPYPRLPSQRWRDNNKRESPIVAPIGKRRSGSSILP